MITKLSIMALKRTNGKRNNVKYLIASHGEYAAGLTSAVCRLAGENPDVTALCAYTDGNASGNPHAEDHGGA